MAIKLPDWAEEVLFSPYRRYRILYGGRGSAKSHTVAMALLIKGMQGKLRVLCAREFQASIADSVHKLLADKIADAELDDFYEVQKTTIKGRNGTEFIFAGLRHNISSIKSTEGIDIVWIEEGQTVSKASWDVLIPTIRAEGSEIWVTFNPELDTDETYQRFVARPPESSIVRKVNWDENPFFPSVLKLEKDELLKRDPDAYDNVWQGNCRKTVEGAIYSKELNLITERGQICKVNYSPEKPVSTFWDLGWNDNTSIWFVQRIGLEYRFVDFMQVRQTKLSDIVTELQNKGYVYGADILPHDARHKTLAADGLSIKQQLEALGRRVEICPDASVSEGINAARTILPSCWFDADRCADGLQALRHYRYEWDDIHKVLSRKPLHDWASHAADAMRYFAVGKQLMESAEFETWHEPIRTTMGAIC